MKSVHVILEDHAMRVMNAIIMARRAAKNSNRKKLYDSAHTSLLVLCDELCLLQTEENYIATSLMPPMSETLKILKPKKKSRAR